MNRTIVAMLKKYVSSNGKDWDIKLRLVLMAIWSTPQRSTGVTPFEMMTGRQMTLPLHLLYHPEDIHIRLAKRTWNIMTGKQPTVNTKWAKKFSISDLLNQPGVPGNFSQNGQAPLKLWGNSHQWPTE
ncbi:hypothetical protein XENOCAPTIV_016835 [Xenoophorus captivus]|uniref:Uncharacterized protein n=1 Tax=Xenoophorus captivus TaxID=1517983 RepID=A0ABV0RJE4_9TELE